MFKLKDLVAMYSSRVKQLGTSLNGRINSTHLKDRILAHFPDLHALKDGRGIILIFNEDIGPAMRKACELDAESNAIHLARASLVALVSMILYGPNIKTQSSHSSKPQAVLTLAQFLKFNSFTRCRDVASHTIRHNEERETPLPQYLGVLIHSKTRKGNLWMPCLNWV